MKECWPLVVLYLGMFRLLQDLVFFSVDIWSPKKTTTGKVFTCKPINALECHYRAFLLTWPTSMQIYWNKRKCLHKKRVQLPQDWFGTPTWPPFHCFGTPIWPPWRHVKTLYLHFRATLYSLLIKDTRSHTGKYCSVAFNWLVLPKDFARRLKSLSHLIEYNEQYQRKATR